MENRRMTKTRIYSYLAVIALWVIALFGWFLGASLQLPKEVGSILVVLAFLLSLILAFIAPSNEPENKYHRLAEWLTVVSLGLVSYFVILPLWQPYSVLNCLGAITSIALLAAIPAIRLLLNRVLPHNSTTSQDSQSE